MKTKLLALIATSCLLALPARPAEARRRRAPRGRIYGKLVAKWLHQATLARQTKAYWMFGVPELQQKRPRESYRAFLVFLDVWDENRVNNLPAPDLRVEGAALLPRVLVIPRRSDTESFTIHNLDLMTHRLTSTDHGELRHVVLTHNARSTIRLDNLLPLQKGHFAAYRLWSRDLRHLRSEIVLLKSSAFTLAKADGTFKLKGLPRGEYTLRVYYGGKILLSRRVEIGRKAVNLKTVLLPQPPP